MYINSFPLTFFLPFFLYIYLQKNKIVQGILMLLDNYLGDILNFISI